VKHRKPKDGERLKITTVDFEFADRRPKVDSSVTIRFCHDNGKPDLVSVFWDGCEEVAYVVRNDNGRYKPCMTHAKEILALITKQPSKTEFERQRRKALRPGLKVFG
jgi:hypothetical protein